ncbi:TPA: Gfo/Idh/MocA family oxidoreductase [bacterium]|nr:Gfo/Idh/MocA family oxidoreductase [bacterium]
MNNESARIAFIGAGNHSTESLYPNIAHIPEFDLVAVCDIVEERAKYIAHRYGAPEWFTDVDKMLDKVQPQGVCIVGPPEMHYKVGLQVLRRKIPIFVEKPPALTMYDALELAETAKQNGVWGMVGFMKRFAPANIVAKEFMSSDNFGKLSSITAIHGSGPYDDIRRMLFFNGIHMIDLLRFFAGDVTSLFAYGFGQGNAQAVSVAMQFANGSVGQLNMNSGHNWSDCFEQTYISGSGAGILIDASKSTEVMSQDRRFAKGEGQSLYGWSSKYYVSGNMAGWTSGGHYTRGYCGELDHFAKAVLGITKPYATLEDGVEAVRIIDAIMESILSKLPVSF